MPGVDGSVLFQPQNLPSKSRIAGSTIAELWPQFRQRNPARLHASASRVDLARFVPRIVTDHEHLLVGKELTIVCGVMPSAEVLVPEAIATAAKSRLQAQLARHA